MERSFDALVSPKDYGLVREALLRLLGWKIERYTMGESTSVPAEVAQELLESVCYCLDIAPECDERWDRLIGCDLGSEYRAGLERVKERARRGKLLWEAVGAGLPPAVNGAMTETLAEIGGFWKKYDPTFFAHQIPCTVTYPLAVPVPKGVLGVDYINGYLLRLLAENRFLSEYRAEAVGELLGWEDPDLRDLPIGIFEPVANRALALALLDKPDGTLDLGQEELAGLYALLEPMDRNCITACLRSGVQRLGERHPALGKESLAYLSEYCPLLAARIDLLRDRGGLGGVFGVR